MFFKEEDLIDVAIGKIAMQSSVCKMSRENDACRVVNPFVYEQNLSYACHTALERNPWWKIDLGNKETVEIIKIENNTLTPETIKFIEVRYSFNDKDWHLIDKDLFVWDGANILTIQVFGRTKIRYIKISLIGDFSLALKRVQIFTKKIKFQEKNGAIIPVRQDGFGARIFAFINAKYLADKANLKFAFWWPLSGKQNDNSVFVDAEENIFDSNYIKKFSCTNEKLENLEPLNIVRITGLKNREYGTMLSWWRNGTLNSSIVPDIDIDDYKKEFSNIWNSIEFTPRIKSILSMVDNIGDEFIGIHIRGGDNVLVAGYRKVVFKPLIMNRFFPLEIVNSLIKLANKEHKRVILFSQDNKTIKKIQENFNVLSKQQVFLTEDFCIEDIKLNQMEKTIFDLKLLSKLKKVYSTNSSLYMKLASLIGKKCEFESFSNIFSIQNQIDIILNSNIVYNNFYKSYSFAYCYYITMNNNQYSYEQKKYFLEKAIQYDEENNAFRIILIDLMLKNGFCEEADRYIETLRKDRWDEFIENLLCKIPAETREGYTRQPLAYLDQIMLLAKYENSVYSHIDYLCKTLRKKDIL